RRPQQRNELARANLQVHIVDGDKVAERMGDVLETKLVSARTRRVCAGLQNRDLRIKHHTQTLIARSSRLDAATSTLAAGCASPFPGPCSCGRATCPVRNPHFPAARRSLVCAATIMQSPGSRSNASQADR